MWRGVGGSISTKHGEPKLWKGFSHLFITSPKGKVLIFRMDIGEAILCPSLSACKFRFKAKEAAKLFKELNIQITSHCDKVITKIIE